MSKELDLNFLETLTPNIEENERNKNYLNALDWAIKQDDVQNIAVSGSYGSGKSSVLKTFSNTLSDDEVLEISVATFNSYKNNHISSHTDDANQTEGNLQSTAENNEIEAEKTSSIEEVIEQHILQQIFYKVPVDKVPNSRFKRISIQKKQFEISDIIHLLFGGFLIFIFFQSATKNFMKSQFIEETAINYGSLFVIIIVMGLIGYLAYIIINTVSKISGYGFTKFGIGNASLELNPKDENSMINKNIDEIIYFFSVTNYNIVIFEDLDRFESLEIFERLRELNGLLNKNQDIDRKIVFIYAIRDDIFSINDTFDEAQNRTKFFDFIIPIVKIANSSNAKEIIRNKLNKENDFAISESLINGVSFFINDMRLIKNICNEFVILYNTLNSNMIDNTKLFAMAVYKNIYPKDFNDLLNNKGEIYQISDKKKQLVEKILEDLRNERAEIKAKINNNDLLVSNYEELLLMFRNIHTQDSFNYVQLSKQYNLNNIENFKEFMEELIVRYHENPNGNIVVGNIYTKTYKIKDYIEGFGNPNLIEKFKLVKFKQENSIYMVEKRLKEITQEISIIKSYSLRKLYLTYRMNVMELVKIQDKPLLNYFIYNGYIAEDYHNYITYFYEGSLSNNDNVFLGKIISGEKLDSTYELDNVKEVICNFPPEYLDTESVYNTAIIKEVYKKSYYENEKYGSNLPVIREYILDNFSLTISFFNEVNLFGNTSYRNPILISYFKQTRDKKKDLESIWTTIYESKSYLTEYSTYILKVFNYDELNTINVDNLYSQYVSNNSDYFLIKISHVIQQNKLLEKLAAINVEFNDLSGVNSDKLLKKILSLGIYKINYNNLAILLKEVKYSSILKLNEKNRYKLEENIIDVINVLDIFMEEEESFIKLLNHPNINKELQVSLISNWFGKITLISDVNNNLYEVLFNQEKYKFNINNIEILYMNNIGLNRLISKILSENNFELINKDLEEIDFSNDFYEKFSLEILNLDSLEIRELKELSKLIKPLQSISGKSINRKTLRFYIENELVVYNQDFYNDLVQIGIEDKNLLFFLFMCVQKKTITLNEAFRLTENPNKLFSIIINNKDIQLTIKQDVILNHEEYINFQNDSSLESLVEVVIDTKENEDTLLILSALLDSNNLTAFQKAQVIKMIIKKVNSIPPIWVEKIADVIDKIGGDQLYEQEIEKLLYSSSEERTIAILLYQLLKNFDYEESNYLSVVKKINSAHKQLSYSRTRYKKLENIPENRRLLELLLGKKYITSLNETGSEFEFNVADIENRIFSK